MTVDRTRVKGVLILLKTNCSEAEKELQEYADEYYAKEFVPFPTAQDAADSVLETIGYVSLENRIPFVQCITELLLEWVEKETIDTQQK